MSTPARVALIGLGTLTGVLLLAHGAWILLVAIIATLDTEEDLA